MRKLSTTEMAVNRYKVSQCLFELAESLKDPDAEFKNVCHVMDTMDYLGYVLDEIRHSAYPEWFKESEE